MTVIHVKGDIGECQLFAREMASDNRLPFIIGSHKNHLEGFRAVWFQTEQLSDEDVVDNCFVVVYCDDCVDAMEFRPKNYQRFSVDFVVENIDSIHKAYSDSIVDVMLKRRVSRKVIGSYIYRLIVHRRKKRDSNRGRIQT